MTPALWKGYHSEELPGFIAKAWDTEELLVLCPPMLKDFSFLKALEETKLPFKPVLGVFTSGTMSSSPRLVLYSRENILAALEGIFSLFDRARIGHIFCYPQAFHTFGLTLGYVAAHVCGWKLHTPHGKYSRVSHEDRLALREPDVLTLGTPTHFYDLLQLVKGGREIAPSYTCIMGGAGVSRALWQSVRDDLKIEAPSIGYGCTEAAPGISHLAPGRAPTCDDEIGFPLSSIDSITGPEGVEIFGSSLCRAIIQDGRVEFPERVMIRDRVLTNDEGSWVYGGRLDLTLNRGGQKFSLEAIEKSLAENLQAGVVAAAVRDVRFGEDLGLAVISTRGRDEFAAMAQDILMREFSLKIAPEKILFVEEFPLNECSKLDRKETKARIESSL